LSSAARGWLRKVPVWAWMVLIAFALRVVVIPFDTIENLMDADHIHSWEPGNVAASIMAGKGFGSSFNSTQPGASLTPVYPYIVAAFFYVFGVHTALSIFTIHAFDCAINSLACIPIFLLARRSFGERAGKWAAWTWVFFPYGIYFAAAWAWGTHLLLLGLLWLLFMAQEMEVSPRLTLWAGFGLLAGVTGLDEPSIFIVVPFLTALAAVRLALGGKRWLLPGVVASLVLAAAISPWLIRNAVVFHRFIPMRANMGLELWMGNNGNDLRWTSDELNPLHNQKELADFNRMGEVAYNEHKASQAHAYIHEHRGWYEWMCVRRAVYLWTGYWSFDPRYLAVEPMDPANIPFATCLTLLGLAGLFLAWREHPFEAIRYGGVLFLFPAMYYFSHPEPYDMRPLDPLLVILGCYAILRFRQRERKSAYGLATSANGSGVPPA
jgi:4-amino-4-deoxy-L-arabinose transferase-like glycosyltransferase